MARLLLTGDSGTLELKAEGDFGLALQKQWHLTSGVGGM